MVKDVAYYQSLVTAEHAGKPKFMAVVGLVAGAFAAVQAFNLSMYQAFDLDTAIGVQLDAVGARAGISRYVVVPVRNPWLSADDPTRGIDFAPIKTALDVGSFQSALGDESFRRLIRAKIAANNGDGSIATAYAVLTAFINNTASQVIIQNNATANAQHPDVSVVVGIAGQWPDYDTMIILERQMIPLFPAGVAVTVLFPSINGAAIAGMDIESSQISGTDVGAVGVSADFVINI